MNNIKKKKKINRYSVVIIIMFIIFSAIIARLVYLQVFKYDDYKDRANTRSTRFISEKAPRGKIYDANGNLLATNVQTYVLTFTETTESTDNFYSTMSKVFKLLDENGEKQQDDFKLKLNEKNQPYFDFNVSSDDSNKALEIRFKRDRGLDYEISKKLFPNKQELSDSDEAKIDEELLKISPEDTFYYLVKSYKLQELLITDKSELKNYEKMTGEEITKEILKKISYSELRRYMVVKDAIKMQSFSGFKPVTIANISKRDTAFIFYQKLNSLPGIDVSMEPTREYPYGTLASSVIGYVSSIDSSKKSRYEERGYDVSTDLIGKAGIESAFESYLKGSVGGTTVKVNSQGRKTEELFKLEPSPGKNVHLTIDKNIQYSAEQTLQAQLEYVKNSYVDYETGQKGFNATRGAAVAIEAKTGRVLALVSYPNYDPNIFSQPGQLTPELSKQLFSPDYETFAKQFITQHNLNKTVDDLFPKDSNGVRQDKYDLYPKPFYNYATMGLIPPGSTFKPLTSLAALEEGVVDANTRMNDRKYFNTRPEILGSWAPADDKLHGNNIDITEALAVSCNFYYYESAVRMYLKNGTNKEGLNSIAKYAWKLGMGTDPNSNTKPSTGIEIGESFGQTYNYDYFKSQTLYYSRYELVNFLENGKYGNTGSYSFVALDIGNKDSDSDELKEAKQKVKDLIINFIKNVNGSKINAKELNAFNADLKPLLDNLQTNSKIFSDRIKSYNSMGKKYSHSAVIAAIDQFIYDKVGAINTPAELVNASIGQGVNNFSLVQIASYISTIVNGGTRYKVHLVDKITDVNGNTVDEYKPEVLGKVDMKPSTLQLIKEGMRKANAGEEGTASAVFRGFPISTGGKTGTATYSSNQSEFGRSAFGVYVSFAPVEDPQIVVAVVLYDGAHGYLGAPVARAIYETYFREEIKKQYPNYTPMFSYTLTPPLEDKKDSSLEQK